MSAEVRSRGGIRHGLAVAAGTVVGSLIGMAAFVATGGSFWFVFGVGLGAAAGATLQPRGDRTRASSVASDVDTSTDSDQTLSDPQRLESLPPGDK